jgi:dihydrofolate reductase
VTIISALTRKGVIGKDNAMPWHISEESKLFKKLTLGGTLIMGRKTFESFGSRPLPRRKHIIVSRSMPETEGVDICRTLKDAVDKAGAYEKDVFCIGGSEIYRQMLPKTNRLYLSYVKEDYPGDIYFPEFDLEEWQVVREEDHKEFTFVEYERKNPT